MRCSKALGRGFDNLFPPARHCRWERRGQWPGSTFLTRTRVENGIASCGHVPARMRLSSHWCAKLSAYYVLPYCCAFMWKIEDLC